MTGHKQNKSKAKTNQGKLRTMEQKRKSEGKCVFKQIND